MATYGRTLGTGLILGAAAGALWLAGRRYNQSAPPRLINWDVVRRTAAATLRTTAGAGADFWTPVESAIDYADRVRRSQQLITEYTGDVLPRALDAVYVYDRLEWVDSNIVGFQQLFEPIEELYGRVLHDRTVGLHLVGNVNQLFLSGQLGVLLGYLSQRVLGQYDLALLGKEPIATGKLYFVERNIAALQEKLGLPADEFRLWIALHETTHAFEFEAHPWLRDHMNGLLRRYFETLSADFLDLKGVAGSPLVSFVGRVSSNLFKSDYIIELVMTPEQRVLFRELQALMCVIEGYSNHVMDHVGRQMLSGYDEMKRRFEERLKNKGPAERLFTKLTGLDIKLEQYLLGERFVNTVVAQRGIDFAQRFWSGPEYLPSLDEVRRPEKWIDRVAAKAA